MRAACPCFADVSPSYLQYFEHVEEAEWAVQTLKETGKPVAACMCIGPDGDMHGVTPGDCAIRLVKAGGYKTGYSHNRPVDMNNSLQGGPFCFALKCL